MSHLSHPMVMWHHISFFKKNLDKFIKPHSSYRIEVKIKCRMHCALIHTKAQGPRVLSAPGTCDSKQSARKCNLSWRLFSFQTPIIYLERAKVKCLPPAYLKYFTCVAYNILPSPKTIYKCIRMFLGTRQEQLLMNKNSVLFSTSKMQWSY